MRVVAGTARGRTLRAPAGRATRPTSDRVREAMFDMLTSMDEIDGAAVADLFAGSGALGIEALSRGASSAVLVDRDPGALEAARANVAVLDAPPAASVVRAEVLGWLRQGGGRFDLVFADPPYDWTGWSVLGELLATRCGLLVAETAPGWAPPAGWDPVRSRRYGTTLVTLLRPAPIALGRPAPIAPGTAAPAPAARAPERLM